MKTDLFETIGTQAKNHAMLVGAGLSPEQATKIAFTPNQQRLIRVEGAFFDALIKQAFLTGALHGATRITGNSQSDDQAIADCIREINSMV